MPVPDRVEHLPALGRRQLVRHVSRSARRILDVALIGASIEDRAFLALDALGTATADAGFAGADFGLIPGLALPVAGAKLGWRQFLLEAGEKVVALGGCGLRGGLGRRQPEAFSASFFRRIAFLLSRFDATRSVSLRRAAGCFAVIACARRRFTSASRSSSVGRRGEGFVEGIACIAPVLGVVDCIPAGTGGALNDHCRGLPVGDERAYAFFPVVPVVATGRPDGNQEGARMNDHLTDAPDLATDALSDEALDLQLASARATITIVTSASICSRAGTIDPTEA